MNITKKQQSEKNLRPCIILPTLKLSHYYTQNYGNFFGIHKNNTKDNYLGGCIISLNHEINEVDQTFISYNDNFSNASKFLIYLSANFFGKYFNRYVLGGEITKNDNLGKFKQSFSTKISFFTRMFFCKKNNKDYKKFKLMTEIERWP